MTTTHVPDSAPAPAARSAPPAAAPADDQHGSPARALPAGGLRLCRHGARLVLLGLVTGLLLPLLANPRMGLASHLEGVLNGMLLLLLGLCWAHLQLSARGRRWLFGLLLYGTYTNWAATLLAAAFGTGRSTPIAGAGHAGLPWQEALVDFGLFSLSLAMLAALALVLRGLRPPRATYTAARDRSPR